MKEPDLAIHVKLLLAKVEQLFGDCLTRIYKNQNCRIVQYKDGHIIDADSLNHTQLDNYMIFHNEELIFFQERKSGISGLFDYEMARFLELLIIEEELVDLNPQEIEIIMYYLEAEFALNNKKILN